MQYPMQYVIAEHTAARMMQKINMGHVLRLSYDLNITNYLLPVNRLFKIFSVFLYGRFRCRLYCGFDSLWLLGFTLDALHLSQPHGPAVLPVGHAVSALEAEIPSAAPGFHPRPAYRFLGRWQCRSHLQHSGVVCLGMFLHPLP